MVWSLRREQTVVEDIMTFGKPGKLVVEMLRLCPVKMELTSLKERVSKFAWRDFGKLNWFMMCTKGKILPT